MKEGWIPHRPTNTQARFLLMPDKEVLYGGAARGGKSYALLMAALMFVYVKGYSALLLRRTYSDLALPGALMPTAEQWLKDTPAHWYNDEKTWKFPSGATITFGYLESERDKYRYQSSQFQFIAFDELTQFTESQYSFLFSRLTRPEGSHLPLRMRSATNPGGVGHEWVRKRFISNRQHGRKFAPAKLEDNPYVDQRAYEEALLELDPITRQQLRHGDWDIRAEGNMFKREWFKMVEKIPRDLRLVRYWDLAASEPKSGTDPDYTSGLLLGEKGGEYWIIDVTRRRESPAVVEKLIERCAERDSLLSPYYAVRMEQEGGASGKSLVSHYSRNVLSGYDFRGNRPTGSKVARAMPVSAAAENGLIHVKIAPWNDEFFDELVTFPDTKHKDQVDSLSGAFHYFKTARATSGRQDI
jgi:predicted phage terminase large subunit-like protein